MKILPMRFREKMNEWFGKRGMSMHVDVLFFMDPMTRKLKKVTYFTLMDDCKQDMFAVACVFKHVLLQLCQDLPQVSQLVCRSDNAGCYSGASIIAVRNAICKEVGMTLQYVHFTEPQCGKDQADRDSAVAKSCFRTYVDMGNDLTSALDMKKALDQSLGGLRNSKSSVITIEPEDGSLGKVNIPMINSLHTIAFSNDEMLVWRYFDIGKGKPVKLEKPVFVPGYSVISPFPSQFHRAELCYDPKIGHEKTTVLFCCDDACSATFTSDDELAIHIETADHTYCSSEGLSTCDSAKLMFAKRLKSQMNDARQPVAIQESNETDANTCDLWSMCQKGWALPQRKTTKLSQKQKEFLKAIFDDGEVTKKKCTPANAVRAMKQAKADDGSKKFTSGEYLRKEQVMSYFSRLAKKQRATTVNEV